MDFKKLASEIAKTAILAGAVAGLTALINVVPAIGGHFGLSAETTGQVVLIVGAVRAFVSAHQEANPTK